MSLPDFSGNESHAWSLSPSDNSFQKFKNNFEVVEEVDTFYLNRPEMKFVWAVWRLGDLKLQKICLQVYALSTKLPNRLF